MKKCESCTSCGMPFREPKDHALADESMPYCTYCTHSDGTLKTYEEVLEHTKGYFIRAQGLAPAAAYRMAETLLKTLPAWQRKTQELNKIL